MKTTAIHKRLYTALPRPLTPSSTAPASAPISSRVRSNSASSSRSLYTASQSSLPFAFFDSPAPPPVPSSRPNSANLVSPRLAAEVKAEVENHSPYSNNGHGNAPQTQSQHGGPPPYSLAFTSGQSEASSSHIPTSYYNPFFPYQSFGPVPTLNQPASNTPDASQSPKRQRTRYHLDVGAYGIPKHSRGARVAGRDGGRGGKVYRGPSTRAVQVGEDAYFIRENAMGVADGVGGWSKARRSERTEELSPSALFANRLMHYCCEEVDAALSHPESNLDQDLHEQLEDSLEELADGLDVLMILEKAYDKTMKAHVGSTGTDSTSGLADNRPSAMCTHASNTPPLISGKASRPPSPSEASQRSISTSPERAPTNVDPVPLLQGSSTALVAILEHLIPHTPKPTKPTPLFYPSPRHLDLPVNETSTSVAEPKAVIRVAHLGDSMGMLIRGEEIVWRTEEMWWNFNTPVQLGPTSSTRPTDARIFTIPVEEDDILILASDGLSDNLWDEDILDEVVRFRRSFLSSASSPSPEPQSSLGASLRRGTLAGMLSEALCSRARCVSERRGCHSRRGERSAAFGPRLTTIESEDEIPFGRRAREMGKAFSGGKPDDISVLVAVVSPVE